MYCTSSSKGSYLRVNTPPYKILSILAANTSLQWTCYSYIARLVCRFLHLTRTQTGREKTNANAHKHTYAHTGNTNLHAAGKGDTQNAHLYSIHKPTQGILTHTRNTCTDIYTHGEYIHKHPYTYSRMQAQAYSKQNRHTALKRTQRPCTHTYT